MLACVYYVRIVIAVNLLVSHQSMIRIQDVMYMYMYEILMSRIDMQQAMLWPMWTETCVP